MPGRDLFGLTYDGPFDELPAQNAPGGVFPYGDDRRRRRRPQQAHRVIAWSDVGETEGTGLVHIAPGCGAEDQELGKENGIPFIAPLDESAHVHRWLRPVHRPQRQRGGRRRRGGAESIRACWWRARNIRTCIRTAGAARRNWSSARWTNGSSAWTGATASRTWSPRSSWIPPDGEARELDWLRNMGDWMISKKRFWGLALPIWVCGECEHFTVIGSREELQRAGRGRLGRRSRATRRIGPTWTPSRSAARSAAAMATRIEDVGNPWLDAGIVPFSTMGYNTDRDYWEKWFPADFVLESFPGQFRNWFYSMLAMSAMMDGARRSRRCWATAWCAMRAARRCTNPRATPSPSTKPPRCLGAEVMRYIYAEQKTAQHLNFPDLHPTGNAGADHRWRSAPQAADVLELLQLFRDVRRAPTAGSPTADAAARDQRTGPLGAEPPAALGRRGARTRFGNYEHFRVIEAFQEFDEQFSNWYLRRSRRRFWDSDPLAYQTLYTVLTTVIRVMAPALPFLTEEIYQNLVRSVDPSAPESVHLTPYPQGGRVAGG